MKRFIVPTICFLCVSANNGWQIWDSNIRQKRDVGGALDIVTNNAQPIHAEVKTDNANDTNEKVLEMILHDNASLDQCRRLITHAKDGDDKYVISHTIVCKVTVTTPCPKTNREVPSIDSGVVFKVTPPKDTAYEVKSLRKSWPSTSKLDLVRSINRLITLIILAVLACIEFYPMLKNLYQTVSAFLFENNNNIYNNIS